MDYAISRTKKSMFQYDSDFQNLYETLLRSARKHPDKIALIDGEITLSYSDFLERVDKIAASLTHRYNIKAGDRIAIMQVNSINFCCCLYAVLKVGAIAVMVNTKLQGPEVRHILSSTEASVLFLDKKWLEKVEGILLDTFIRQLIVDSDVDVIKSKLPVATICSLYSCANHVSEEGPCLGDEEATAVIMFTSGTTGKPKGAMLSHRNLIQSVLSYADLLKLKEDETVVLPIPAFHITGLTCIVNLFVYLGATVVLMPAFDAIEVLRKIEQHKATHFHAVPTVFMALSKAIEDFSGDLSSLRTALCGGGFITHEAIQALKRKLSWLDFRPVYGLTETSGAGVGFPCDYSLIHKASSAGTPTPIAEVFICKQDGEKAAQGEIGEICFRGPTVIKGYYGIGDLPDGILHTGDVGRIDADGFVYVMDRIKDIINRGGEKIYSLEVENVIMEMPEVRQVAVFGLPDEYYGEVVAAAIVTRDPHKIQGIHIQEFLKSKIAKFKIPSNIIFVDKMPVNANNKVLKSKLRETFQHLIPSSQRSIKT